MLRTPVDTRAVYIRKVSEFMYIAAKVKDACVVGRIGCTCRDGAEVSTDF